MDWSSLGAAGLEVLKFVLPIISSVLLVVVTAFVKRWLDKMGVERSATIDKMIDEYVTIGINYADRAARLKLDGKVLGPNDKLALATKAVLAELDQSKIKGVTEELIRARIESTLEKAKLPPPVNA
jgi:secreted Zn-dependent insulinase-like peptidase